MNPETRQCQNCPVKSRAKSELILRDPVIFRESEEFYETKELATTAYSRVAATPLYAG